MVWIFLFIYCEGDTVVSGNFSDFSGVADKTYSRDRDGVVWRKHKAGTLRFSPEELTVVSNLQVDLEVVKRQLNQQRRLELQLQKELRELDNL